MSTSDTYGCEEWEFFLHGYMDGELDAAHALRFEEHAACCASCSAAMRKLQALRRTIGQANVSWSAPETLRERVLSAIALEETTSSGIASSLLAADRVPRRLSWEMALDVLRRWSLVPSLAVLAASLLLVATPPDPNPRLQGELVSNHVRSLLADHLTDVATSDQHAVKPWFSGRIEFSPPVIDLTSQGFPLLGGRVDYVGGRVVAALIYRRNGHIINLFVWPALGAPSPAVSRDGYNLINWTQAGLDFWAVSDLNVAELRDFQEHLSESTPR
jgi:anti-sigma factor RsiW